MTLDIFLQWAAEVIFIFTGPLIVGLNITKPYIANTKLVSDILDEPTSIQFEIGCADLPPRWLRTINYVLLGALLLFGLLYFMECLTLWDAPEPEITWPLLLGVIFFFLCQTQKADSKKIHVYALQCIAIVLGIYYFIEDVPGYILGYL